MIDTSSRTWTLLKEGRQLATPLKGTLLVGTKRMGAVIARRLAAEGVPLAICYRSSKGEAEELVKSLGTSGARSLLLQGDMADENDVRRVVHDAADGLGGVQAIVNLASGFRATPFDALDGPAWDEGMTSAKSAYLLAVHGARQIRSNDGPTRGHIILFSDWAAGETPYPGYLPYLTGKAAIAFMTRAFAAELAPQGILVNAVAPGPTLRPPEVSEETWKRDVLNQTPLRRESSPEDIAEIVLALLKSETITGEVIRVDSGRHVVGPGMEG